jgi:hypothetical protein
LASDEYREVDAIIGGSREGPFVMLEPDEGKLAPVLRGRVGVIPPGYPTRSLQNASACGHIEISVWSLVFNHD